MKASFDKHTVSAITATGLAATIAQIVVLRELLVLFQGIELFIGIVLACWLFWNGCGCGMANYWVRRHHPTRGTLAIVLSMVALTLPLTAFFIRTARYLWCILPGELPSFNILCEICLLSTALPSILSGMLFGLCWILYDRTSGISPGTSPIAVFMGEALGATTGGLGFYVFFACHQPILNVLWMASLGLLIVAGSLNRPWTRQKGLSMAVPIWLMSVIAILLGVLFRTDVEKMSRTFQWHDQIIAVADTPYQNIAATQKEKAVSVLSNGLWLYSIPDRPTAEWSVHPALLQHPRPQSILMFGAGSFHFATEALKHNESKQLDVVELDPALPAFEKKHLGARYGIPTAAAPMKIYHQDAASFLRHPPRRYDVIIMRLGDPISAQMNRFYTVSFFQQVKRALTTGGIFSLSVSGGEDMLGEDQIIFLKGILQTLQTVFDDVMILPGDHIQFFSTNATGRLIRDFETLSHRIEQRHLSLSYVRKDVLEYLMTPIRRQYFNSVLTDGGPQYVNSDFSNRCYLNTLRMVSAQWHASANTFINSIGQHSPLTFWSVLVLIAGVFLCMYWRKSDLITSPIRLSVITAGAVNMALQMIMLLVFQTLVGVLYLHMVTIVASFMAGLAIGAGWGAKTSRLKELTSLKGHFLKVQLLFFVYPMALAILFTAMPRYFHGNFFLSNAALVFSCLSLGAGVIGGRHFSLATALIHTAGIPLRAIGGPLYGLDLLGSSAGVLVTTLFLVPGIGPIQTLLVFGFIAGVCLLILARRL